MSKQSLDVLSQKDIERIQKAYEKPDTKIFDNDGFSIRVKSKGKNKIKLIIENHKFYFHPTYIAYAGSLNGYVVHAITRIPTLGVINEKGYYKFTVENDWGRCLHVHDFIWECFHGLLK